MADESDTVNLPFETLRDYEKRSLVHAVGLPEQASSHWAWSGIAFRLADASLVSEIGDIVEILTYPDVTAIPGSKFWVMGIANVRGNLVSRRRSPGLPVWRTVRREQVLTSPGRPTARWQRGAADR